MICVPGFSAIIMLPGFAGCRKYPDSAVGSEDENRHKDASGISLHVHARLHGLSRLPGGSPERDHCPPIDNATTREHLVPTILGV